MNLPAYGWCSSAGRLIMAPYVKLRITDMSSSRPIQRSVTMRYESPNPVPAVGSGRLRARHHRARAHQRLPAPPSGTCTQRGAAALLVASWLQLGQAARCENRVGIFGPYYRSNHRHVRRQSCQYLLRIGGLAPRIPARLDILFCSDYTRGFPGGGRFDWRDIRTFVYTYVHF